MNAPLFFEEPEQLPQREHAELIRTPHTKPLKAIITSEKIIACPTHYHARRTIPCKGPAQCDLCATGHKWRLHAYVSAINLENLGHVIIEFPARQYDQLAEWYKRFGTIRGLYIESTRPNARPNGPINLVIKRPASPPPNLPDPLNLKLLLCKIWGVPYEPEPNYTPTTKNTHQTNNNNKHTHYTNQTPNPQNTNNEPTPITDALRQALAQLQNQPPTDPNQ